MTTIGEQLNKELEKYDVEFNTYNHVHKDENLGLYYISSKNNKLRYYFREEKVRDKLNLVTEKQSQLSLILNQVLKGRPYIQTDMNGIVVMTEEWAEKEKINASDNRDITTINSILL